MVAKNQNRRPGDLILDRYMPNAAVEEREVARENLRAFAVVVVGIAKRLALEEREQAIRANDRGAVDSDKRRWPLP